MTGDSDHLRLSVVDSTGYGRFLKVIVRDDRDGKTFHVDFKRNLHGGYRHDGGGGYKSEERWEAAKDVAAAYVEAELNRTVVPKDRWTVVKPLVAKRVLEQHPDYEVREVTGDTKNNEENA